MAEWAEDLFQVSIKGPGPYGFRLYGGDGDPLIVAKLRARSKAHDAGLREGDAVLGINGRSCQTVSHGVAMTLLETADDVLHLHLYRGSTSRKTIAAVYDAIGNQLRPVSPGTAPPNRSAAPATSTAASDQPTPSAAETIDSAAPPPPVVEKDAPTRNENVTSYPRQEVTSYPRQEVTSYPRQEVTSYSQQEMTSSIGAGVTQKTTTETEDRGGVTVTKVTRELTIGGGPAAIAPAAPAEGESGVKGQRSTTVLFHSVPKQATKVQPMRWTPSGVGTKEEEHTTAANTSVLRLQGKENLPPPSKNTGLFGELGGVGQPQQQQFKVYKTTAKLLMWQPSDVPSLPVREPSPAMTFEVLETREFQPRPQQEEKGSRPPRHSDAVDGTDDNDPFGLSPQLFHVLTTEASYDEDLILGRKKKIFADSSFYDDPEQKYPTIEEQIKMARRVALSLSAPDNVTARGQRMFMKRKEKANHWSTDQSLDGLNPYVVAGPPGKARPQRLKTARKELFYNPTPWSAAAASSGEKVATEAIRETLDGCPDDGEQSSASFAKSRALFEKRVDREGGGGGGGGGELPWKKALHGSGGPAGAQLYAGLVNDLRGMKGKGAKLFAQKRARALEEEDEDEEEQEVAVGGWQSEGEAAAVGGPRERGGGGDEYEAPDRSIDVEDAPSARRGPEEPGSGSTRPSYPWETKAVLTPWRTIGAAAAAAKDVASEQRRARAAGREDDAWLQKTTAEDIPGFIAQKTPSTSYRPVRFHLPSNGPGPGITDF